MFPSDAYRYWGHWTDQTGTPVALDAHMRAHAHVEDHIQRLKTSGLERMPFSDFDANTTWLALVCWAGDLARWFQQLTCGGRLAKAAPKQLRWTLWHTPGRLTRSGRRTTIRLPANHPTTPHLARIYNHIAALN